MDFVAGNVTHCGSFPRAGAAAFEFFVYLCAMSIIRHAENPGPARITSPESMYAVIRELGIVPFFENPIRGYSIEELTPKEFWFDDDSDELGPWDWKIYAVQCGDIAYGKFLWGGKAAFATPEWYAHLLNWRRSQSKYQPDEDQKKILDYLKDNGSIGIREIRHLLGIKKGQADTLMMRLQMQCRTVTGDIERVYRGEDLHYNGWQRSAFCAPEDLFDGIMILPSCSPEESYHILESHIKEIAPEATPRQISRMI